MFVFKPAANFTKNFNIQCQADKGEIKTYQTDRLMSKAFLANSKQSLFSRVNNPYQGIQMSNGGAAL